MKILVTGGAGYIGGTLTRLLLAQGHSVTVYDNLCHSKRLAVDARAEFIEGDIADRALLEKTLSHGRFDGVMHFAALIEAGESMKRPEIYFRNNTAASLTLLEAMLATGHDRLVFSSTAACYGEPESTRQRLRNGEAKVRSGGRAVVGTYGVQSLPVVIECDIQLGARSKTLRVSNVREGGV